MPPLKEGETENQSKEGNCPTRKPVNLLQKSDSNGQSGGCMFVGWFYQAVLLSLLLEVTSYRVFKKQALISNFMPLSILDL